jgi:hypothetical protein
MVSTRNRLANSNSDDLADSATRFLTDFTRLITDLDQLMLDVNVVPTLTGTRTTETAPEII